MYRPNNNNDNIFKVQCKKKCNSEKTDLSILQFEITVIS